MKAFEDNFSQAEIEENLRFGVLAYQNGFITQEQFSKAVRNWMVEAQVRPEPKPEAGAGANLVAVQPLSETLVKQGCLTELGCEEVKRLAKQQASVCFTFTDTLSTSSLKVLESVDHSGLKSVLARLAISRPTLESRYSTLAQLAEGGLGKVLVVRDNSLHRDVAFKEIKPQFVNDEKLQRLFLREAQITGQLEHPNIVPVYELAHRPEDNQPFYTMKLIEGKTLGNAIRQYHQNRVNSGHDDPVEFQRLLNIFVSVCNAMSYAHSRNVIHRDLKPANVVLGDFGEVIVLDWGLAEILEAPSSSSHSQTPITSTGTHTEAVVRGVTFHSSWLGKQDSLSTPKPVELSAELRGQTPAVSGTPAYMAPEQAHGISDWIDARSDIYGLGAILFEILTGRPPILAPNAVNAVLQVQTQIAAPRVRSIRPKAPKALDAICATAMAQRREDRYQTAAALGEEIQRWLADEPVQAAPDPLSVKVRRWIKRNPAKASAMVTAAVTIMIALSAVSLVLRSYNQQLAEAKQLAEKQFDLSMKAIKSFHTGVSEDIVLNNPQLEELRFKLLDEPRTFYEQLLKNLESTSGDFQRNRELLAETLSELANVNEDKGSTSTAIANYEKARDVFAQLVKDRPNDHQRQLKLAHAHRNLGILYQKSNRVSDAEQAFLSSLRLVEKITADDPKNVGHQRNLAVSLNNLGLLYKATNRVKAAEPLHLQALGIREQLVQIQPNDSSSQSELAESHVILGLLYGETNRVEEAEKYNLSALKVREQLAKAHPKDTRHAVDLAASYVSLGILCMKTNRKQDSEQHLLSALKIREQISNANPTVTKYLVDFAATHNNLGVLYSATNRHQDTENALRAGLKIFEQIVSNNPSVSSYKEHVSALHNNLGILYCNQGRWKDAEVAYQKSARILTEIVKANPTISEYPWSLARTYQNLGLVRHLLGQLDGALESHQASFELRERVAAANPTISSYQIDLAKGCDQLGVIYREKRQEQKAEEFLLRGLKIREEMVASNPKIAECRSDLGEARQNLANLYLDANRFAQAQTLYLLAIEDKKQVVKANSSTVFYQGTLASCYDSLASFYHLTCQFEKSERTYKTAIGLFEEIVKSDGSDRNKMNLIEALTHIGELHLTQKSPEQVWPYFQRAESVLELTIKTQGSFEKVRGIARVLHQKQAETLMRWKKHRDAMVYWDRALKIAPAESQLEIRIKRAACLALNGAHSEALQELEAFRKAPPNHAEQIYELAKTLAIISAATRSESLALEALNWLRQLASDRFFQVPVCQYRLNNDPAFDSLRKRPDSRQLFNNFTFPVDPFHGEDWLTPGASTSRDFMP